MCAFSQLLRGFHVHRRKPLNIELAGAPRPWAGLPGVDWRADPEVQQMRDALEHLINSAHHGSQKVRP